MSIIPKNILPQKNQYDYHFPKGILTVAQINDELLIYTDDAKKQELLMMNVGWKIAGEITSRDIITIGSGRTSEAATWAIGQRIKNGEIQNIGGIATSSKLAHLASELQIGVQPFKQTLEMIREEAPLGQYDSGYDGADEVEFVLDDDGFITGFRMIKGGGGAHTIEKLIAGCCDNLKIIVDEKKVVKKLGKYPVAIEVDPNRGEEVERVLKNSYGSISLKYKETKDGERFVTDLDGHILYAEFGEGNIPPNLEEDLNKIDGVVDNGLFLSIQPSSILVADIDGKVHLLKIGDKIDRDHPLAHRILETD